MTKILFILAALALPARDLPGDAANLWNPENALFIGLGGSVAAAARVTDDTPGDRLSSVDGAARMTDVYGAGSFNIPVALGIWGFGQASGQSDMASFGYGLTRTLGLTQLVVGPLKLVSRRKRPDGSNRYSFPSGHTANTFAIARYVHRRTGTAISMPFYALAITTGAGRIQGGKHYLSDVVMGATVGLIVGSTVGNDPRASRYDVQPLPNATGLQLRLRLD